MKRPLPDGTTHLFFTGLELLRRVASLVPPPKLNLTRLHGVFAPGAKLRPFLVPPRGSGEGERGAPGRGEAGSEEGADSESGPGRVATKDLRGGCGAHRLGQGPGQAIGGVAAAHVGGCTHEPHLRWRQGLALDCWAPVRTCSWGGRRHRCAPASRVSGKSLDIVVGPQWRSPSGIRAWALGDYVQKLRGHSTRRSAPSAWPWRPSRVPHSPTRAFLP
jgi:hypothetical protein